MTSNLSLTKEQSVKYSTEEQRNIIIDEIKKAQGNLQTNIKDDIIANNCLNHVIKEISNRTVNVRFDYVLDFGLDYVLGSDMTVEQKNRVVKELAIISCKLMRYW